MDSVEKYRQETVEKHRQESLLKSCLLVKLSTDNTSLTLYKF